MEIQITSTVEIDVEKIVNMRDNDAFWMFAATTWHELYSPYVPRRDGFLMEDVEIAPKTITHTSPYAHYQYVGEVYGPNYPIIKKGVLIGFHSPKGEPKTPTGASLMYSTDINPLASAEWDKAAIPTQMDTLIQRLQAYVNGEGGGPVGG